MAFSVFGGVAFVGFLMSFGIRSEQLESDGLEEEEDDSENDEDDDVERR